MTDPLPDVKVTTPRTDNEWKFSVPGEYGLFVRQIFAQQLERELVEAQEDLRRTESARVAILAENTHYKQQLREALDRVAKLERDRTFIALMGTPGECHPIFDRAGRCGTCTACGKNFTCGAALGAGVGQ